MCLTTGAKVPVAAQQNNKAAAAVVQLGHQWNIDAPEFIPSQQISRAGAQLAQKWNISAPEFIPSHQISEAGVVAQPGRRWNIHAPDFIPLSQTAVAQPAQVRHHHDTMGSACALYAFLPDCTLR